MSLIEKALRQLEIDQRHPTRVARFGEFLSPRQGKIPQQKKYGFLLIIIAGMLLWAGYGFLFYKGLAKSSNTTAVFPMTKEVLPISVSHETTFATNKTVPLQNEDALPAGVSDPDIVRIPVSGRKSTAKSSKTFASHADNGAEQDAAAVPDKPQLQNPASVTLKKVTLIKQDQSDNLKKPLKEVTSKTLTNTTSLNNAGLVCLEEKDFVKARRFFEEALLLDADNEKALNNLGLSFYFQGSKQQAIQCYEKALRANPQNVETYGNLGIIYRKYGQYGFAEKMFEKALAIDPDHPEILYNFALLLEDMKQKERARVYFEQFLKFAPANFKNLKEKVKDHLKSTQSIS